MVPQILAAAGPLLQSRCLWVLLRAQQEEWPLPDAEWKQLNPCTNIPVWNWPGLRGAPLETSTILIQIIEVFEGWWSKVRLWLWEWKCGEWFKIAPSQICCGKCLFFGNEAITELQESEWAWEEWEWERHCCSSQMPQDWAELKGVGNYSRLWLLPILHRPFDQQS